MTLCHSLTTLQTTHNNYRTTKSLGTFVIKENVYISRIIIIVDFQFINTECVSWIFHISKIQYIPWRVNILGMELTIERRRYNVTSSLIDWVHTQNDHQRIVQILWALFDPNGYSIIKGLLHWRRRGKSDILWITLFIYEVKLRYKCSLSRQCALICYRMPEAKVNWPLLQKWINFNPSMDK